MVSVWSSCASSTGVHNLEESVYSFETRMSLRASAYKMLALYAWSWKVSRVVRSTLTLMS